MRPLGHILLSLAFSFILFLFKIPLIDILLFFFSSFFLIDLDHVPRFILKYRSLNPLKFYKKCIEEENSKQNQTKPVFFFHNVETLVLLSIFSLFFPKVFFIFSGFLFHLCIDLIYIHIQRDHKYYKLSLILTLVRNKNYTRLN